MYSYECSSWLQPDQRKWPSAPQQRSVMLEQLVSKWRDPSYGKSKRHLTQMQRANDIVALAPVPTIGDIADNGTTATFTAS